MPAEFRAPGSSHFETHYEQALPFLELGTDAGAQQCEDLLAKVQTKTRVVADLLARLAVSPKWIEHPLDDRCVQPPSVVGHGDVPLQVGLYPNRPAFWCVRHGIIEQVRQHH